MSIVERELEENEAKLDNVLHKIIEASRQIQQLKGEINLNLSKDQNKSALEEIDTLAQIIENLAVLSDEIDVSDEKLTKTAEDEITAVLDDAIKKITNTKSRLL